MCSASDILFIIYWQVSHIADEPQRNVNRYPDI